MLYLEAMRDPRIPYEKEEASVSSKIWRQLHSGGVEKNWSWIRDTIWIHRGEKTGRFGGNYKQNKMAGISESEP